MTRVLRWVMVLAGLAVVPGSAAFAQNIDLGAGGAELIWHGTVSGANAGRWLDQGPLNNGDTRRDLVVGAPGNGSTAGKVYVIFAGPEYTGDRSLALANVAITGPSAGDSFGIASAVGPITVASSSQTSNLVVGAPGALGGRGAVYVFAAPLPSGTLTTADAIYTILGAPGDRLGTALATADINGDGYREIVIGAAGTSRVYIVAGGPGLTGTKDLSSSGADLLINGTGIGNVLQAGDVTGDAIPEIFVGSPSQNAVYMLTGGYPAVSNLPADADVVFSGIDNGDAVGASIRLADLDADGRRDIVIGAPGGDGPDNTRTNAGEVYVVWGRTSYTSMNLASANVTFYGAVNNDSLGEELTAGDINRDTPNDLVMLVSGGGAGEALVFYGRSRSQFGVDAGGGLRRVDFASIAPSRRIIGNGASGRITSAIVFEVTGEGARDIVVGVPADASNAGGAFFTISPKLIASPTSIAVSLQRGQDTNAGVVLANPSTIPISWSVTANRTWLTPSPTSGSSLSGSYGSFTVYISTAGLANGTYTGSLTFSSTSEHLEMSRTVSITLTVTEPSAPPPPPPDPTPTPVHNDFNGDGHMDLLFRNMSTGELVLWTMNNNERIASQMLNPVRANTNWQVVGVGDMNADGKPDLVWQEQTYGDIIVWYMDGLNRTSYSWFSVSRPSEPDWKVVGVVDMNDDGKPDLLLRNQRNAALSTWLLDGTTVTAQVGLNPGSTADIAWEIVGNGDFNGDGHPDILWRHRTNNYLVVWIMNGVNRVSVEWLNPGQIIDVNWEVVATGDLNGDGKVDVIFQNRADGRMVAWIMNGLVRSAAMMLNPEAVRDLNWRITGPK